MSIIMEQSWDGVGHGDEAVTFDGGLAHDPISFQTLTVALPMGTGTDTLAVAVGGDGPSWDTGISLYDSTTTTPGSSSSAGTTARLRVMVFSRAVTSADTDGTVTVTVTGGPLAGTVWRAFLSEFSGASTMTDAKAQGGGSGTTKTVVGPAVAGGDFYVFQALRDGATVVAPPEVGGWLQYELSSSATGYGCYTSVDGSGGVISTYFGGLVHTVGVQLSLT